MCSWWKVCRRLCSLSLLRWVGSLGDRSPWSNDASAVIPTTIVASMSALRSHQPPFWTQCNAAHLKALGTLMVVPDAQMHLLLSLPVAGCLVKAMHTSAHLHSCSAYA